MPSIWITSKSRPERSDAIQSFMRAADSATKRREAAGFDRPAPPGPGTSPPGNPTQRAKLRVATLISNRVMAPLPSPLSPTAPPHPRTRRPLPEKAATPWPLDFNLAAGEADLALRFPPAVRPPVTTSRMPWTTDCLRIAIHHLAKGLHAGSQTKQLEARRNLRQGLKLQRSRRNRSRCSKLVHGVAFLCGITTPSLAAQGEQRRFPYFNIERDNSPPPKRTR